MNEWKEENQYTTDHTQQQADGRGKTCVWERERVRMKEWITPTGSQCTVHNPQWLIQCGFKVKNVKDSFLYKIKRIKLTQHTHIDLAWVCCFSLCLCDNRPELEKTNWLLWLLKCEVWMNATNKCLIIFRRRKKWFAPINYKRVLVPWRDERSATQKR